MSQESEDAPVPTVLPSSTELFYFYGQTLEQCGKYTTGEPMRRLAKVFAKWLKIYSGASAGSEGRGARSFRQGSGGADAASR